MHLKKTSVPRREELLQCGSELERLREELATRPREIFLKLKEGFNWLNEVLQDFSMV